VLRLASRTITVVVLCLALALQWLALQSVAWTMMMVRNAHQVSFCEAIKRTFDGAHPCSLCHVVNKGKASEQKRDFQASTAKIDLVCVSRPIRLLPRLESFQYSSRKVSISDAEYPPPVPPPRLTLS